MTNKEKYRELCKIEQSIPIFSKDWWMDAVCGEEYWDVLLVEKGGQIVASLPYYMKSKLGLKYISQPVLTQTNGAWIKYPVNQKYCTKLAYEKELLSDIVNQIDSLSIGYYNQNFYYLITNWLPFYWKGYKQSTKYTYVIEDLTNLDTVYDMFDYKTRNAINKAIGQLEIKEDCDIETFYNINKMSFSRQDIKIPYTLDFLKKIDATCLEHNCRKIFYAQDKSFNIHAAVYIIWDDNSAYYLMGGADPYLRKSDAMSLLLWEAIRFSATVTKTFDFEGSMIESVERFNRGFGAVQKPYFSIKKFFLKKLLL